MQDIITEDKRKSSAFFLFLTAVACMILGGIARVAFLIHYPVHVRDSYRYAKIIESMDFTDLGTPAVGVYFLSIPHRYFHYDIIRGCIVMNVCIGVLIILLTIFISNIWFKNSYAAFLTGIVAATTPSLIYYSCNLLRENFYLLFIECFIIFETKQYKGSSLFNTFMCSLFATLTMLVRIEGMELFIIFVFVEIFIRWKKKKQLYLNVLYFITSTLFVLLILFYVFSFPINYGYYLVRLNKAIQF